MIPSSGVITARLRALGASLLAEGASGLIPLLIVPVLISRLGADAYALTLPPLALAGLLVGILDFGLAIGLPPLWIRQKRYFMRVRYLIASTLLKMTASAAAGIVFLVAWLVSHPDSSGLSWLGAYLVMFGQTMYPSWGFIVAGRTALGQALNAFGKLIPIIALFAFFRNGHSSGVVNLALGGGAVAAAIAAHLIFLRFEGTKLSSLVSNVKSSWILILPMARRHRRLWIAQLSQSIYRTTLPVVAASSLAPSAFLAFSVSEKCLRACQSVQAFVLQFDFSRLIRTSSTLPMARRFFDSAKAYVFPLSFFIMISYYFAFKGIAPLIFAGNIQAIGDAFELHPILTALVLVGGLNYWLGPLGLGAMNKSSNLLVASVAAGVVSLLAAVVASLRGSASEFALSMAFGELVFFLVALAAFRTQIKNGN